jgi:predicted AlkP superfamily pyrophosphatase or phosphodiesterase
MMMRRILIVCWLLAAGCAATPDRPVASGGTQDAITILVAMDGFRPDYLDKGATPTMSALAADGVRASMRPSFPSVTFPNHYALITGKTPDHNGIVYNKMEDEQRPGVTFTMSPSVASDPYWWADATPLWVSAERQGVRTATMFWPGSDYELGGVRPSRWRLFDMDLPGFARVDQLLAWLDEAGPKPRFLTLYFDLVDTAGHNYGPDAADTLGAVAEVDAAIGRLVAGLEKRGLAASTNLVIVADHGMAEVSEDRIINLDALASADIARVLWDGPTAGVYPRAGREAEAEAALTGTHEHGTCWRKGEMPERFGYGTHRRVPPIVCLAEVGWRYRSAQVTQYAGVSKGAHGFDPDAPEMSAVFVAHGPAFRRGASLPEFPNVSVYPLLAKLIGVTPEAGDGAMEDVRGALRE